MGTIAEKMNTIAYIEILCKALKLCAHRTGTNEEKVRKRDLTVAFDVPANDFAATLSVSRRDVGCHLYFVLTQFCKGAQHHIRTFDRNQISDEKDGPA